MIRPTIRNFVTVTLMAVLGIVLLRYANRVTGANIPVV